MKKLFTILILIILASGIFAQTPEKISYQAVVRDASNNLVTNRTIGIQISILQNSINGNVVYREIFNPNPKTNDNGLLTIEIGSGITVLGSFSGIDWSAGPYFIKTEIDINGGTNYTITSTSQILSVPYALHAKTAERITGAITEADPLWKASPSFGITNTHISNWDNAYTHCTSNSGLIHGSTIVGSNLLRLPNPSGVSFLRINTDNSVSALTANDFRTAIGAGSGTVTSIETGNGITGGTITNQGTIGLTGQALALHNLSTNGIITRTGDGTVATRTINPGAGIIVTNGNGVNGNPTISVKTYQVGDFAHGGIVFWVDATGQHGLVCAKTDQSTGIRWYAGTSCNTMARGDGPYAGKANTAIIIATHAALGGDTNMYAARMCNELIITEGGTTYGDWYLPSMQELLLMHNNRTAIDSTAVANGGTALSSNTFYWSSNEYSANMAKVITFLNGFSSYGGKNTHARVRAIRSF
ncbi:MAG: DUF1566 domain-containing protein [Bacteroidota bacterium]